MQRAIDRAALGSQASPRGWDLARLQRAPVGSDQSTRSRGDHEVERRGVRLEGARGGAVVLRHRPMRAEHDRLLLGRQPSVPDRTLHPLEPYHGTVSHFGHGTSLCESHVRLIPPATPNTWPVTQVTDGSESCARRKTLLRPAHARRTARARETEGPRRAIRSPLRLTARDIPNALRWPRS